MCIWFSLITSARLYSYSCSSHHRVYMASPLPVLSSPNKLGLTPVRLDTSPNHLKTHRRASRAFQQLDLPHFRRIFRTAQFLRMRESKLRALTESAELPLESVAPSFKAIIDLELWKSFFRAHGHSLIIMVVRYAIPIAIIVRQCCSCWNPCLANKWAQMRFKARKLSWWFSCEHSLHRVCSLIPIDTYLLLKDLSILCNLTFCHSHSVTHRCNHCPFVILLKGDDYIMETKPSRWCLQLTIRACQS